MTDNELDEVAAAGLAVAGKPTGGQGSASSARCLSCGAPVVQVYCGHCGQRNDDLRRNVVRLTGDVLRDTFGLDARMWRTLRLLLTGPGVLPREYAHGKRSQFSPPVRLFIGVSFLFFALLALTDTLFVAMEVIPGDGKAAARIVEESEDPRVQERNQFLSECSLNTRMRFLVRPRDLVVDQELWERCRDRIALYALGGAAEVDGAREHRVGATGFVARMLDLTSRAIEEPVAFNASINRWLPRVAFLMTPVLALLLWIFLRGRDALLFDHLVLSFYGHCAGFVWVGAGIVMTQFHVPYTLPLVLLALAVYLAVALRQAYAVSWRRAVLTSVTTGLLYFTVLFVIVMTIVIRSLAA